MSGLHEHVLLGWLCITRYNLSDDGETLLYMPNEIKQALAERGWAEFMERGEGEADDFLITKDGHDASDLAAPEWGIDPVPA